MNLTQITYRRLFNTGSFTNEAIELTGTLSEREDVMQAYSELHKMAQELHFSKNKEFYEQMGTTERVIEKEKPLSTRDAVINGIQTCTEVKVLESYKLLCGVDTELKHIYETKLKELTNE